MIGAMTSPAPCNSTAPKIGVDISEKATWEQEFEVYDAITKSTTQVLIDTKESLG